MRTPPRASHRRGGTAAKPRFREGPGETVQGDELGSEHPTGSLEALGLDAKVEGAARDQDRRRKATLARPQRPDPRAVRDDIHLGAVILDFEVDVEGPGADGIEPNVARGLVHRKAPPPTRFSRGSMPDTAKASSVPAARVAWEPGFSAITEGRARIAPIPAKIATAAALRQLLIEDESL